MLLRRRRKTIIDVAQLLLKLLHFRQDGVAVAHLEAVHRRFRLVQSGPRPLRLTHGGRHGACLAIRHDPHREIVGQPHRGFRRCGLGGHDQRILIRCQFQPDRLADRAIERFTRRKQPCVRPRQKVEKQAKLALIANANHIGRLELEVGGDPVQSGG